MGLDQVIEEVLAEGEREAEAIVQDAREEAEAIVQDAKGTAEEERTQRLEDAEQEAKAERRRIEASAELDAKKKRLDAEADVLASVRSRVESRLADLPQDERAPLVRALIEDAGADEFGEGARAWAPKRDRDVVEEYGFTYEGEIDALGGAVIETPDGSVREDLTFDTLLDEVWRDRLNEVAMNVLET